MRIPRLRLAPLALLLSAACADHAARTLLPPEPPASPTPLGVYEITVTGIGGGEMQSTVRPAMPAPGGPSRTLTAMISGIVFEPVGSNSVTEGTRTDGGQRYVSFTYRVRNATGAPLDNLTMLMVERPGNIAGTPLSRFLRLDGTNANPAIAPFVAPTGSVVLRGDMVTMDAVDPDVVQVFEESEVAAIPLPAGVTQIFPYGYVVRHATSTTTRTLPAAPSVNQYDGVLTLAFRVPLQPTPQADAYALTFQVLAVQDSETRMTESMEETRDTAAVRRLRERAASLGATTVTVLAGSTAAAAEVADYPGQRQLCSVRTAGTAASPVTYLNTPASYTQLELFLPGESYSACGASFRSGTATRPTLSSPWTVNVRAMDRYGNVRTAAVDTVALSQASGPGATFGSAAVLSSGQGSLSVTYTANGVSQLRASGRRLRGQRPVEIATAATVVANTGNNQAAMAGQAVPVVPSVLVRNLSNTPLANVPVTFTVSSGGGYVTSTTTVTNASGIATAGKWVLGTPATVNTLMATAAGASTPVVFTAAGCAGGGGTAYNLTLCYRSPLTATQRMAFENAAARWEQVVTTDLPDLPMSVAADSCGAGSPSFNLSVDDLLIFASVDSIAGPDKFVGLANWCIRRTTSLPSVGTMRFDEADMPEVESLGLLESLVLHEMGHVLGVGDWSTFGLLVTPSPVGGPPLDTYFSGSGGIAGFNAIGGSTYTGGQKVPVQSTGRAGTINAHWRENVLQNELMTAALTPGANPLSLVTVRSLEDMGYTVNPGAADSFFLTLTLRSGPAPKDIPLDGDVMAIPQHTVDARGRVTRIR